MRFRVNEAEKPVLPFDNLERDVAQNVNLVKEEGHLTAMGGQASDAFFQLSHQLLALPGGSLDPRCAFAARVLIADISGSIRKPPRAM